MGKLNLKTYTPKQDSSSNTDQFRRKGIEDDVIIIVRELPNGCSDCLCGCRQQPAGKSSQFRMGHDARFRGALIRAYLTDTKVTTLNTDDGNIAHQSVDPMAIADHLGWADYLKAAQEREAMRADERANRTSATLLASATGPQPGDRKLLKIGRWEYTGQVCAVFEVEGGTEIEYEYVTKSGERKIHRVLKKEGEEV